MPFGSVNDVATLPVPLGEPHDAPVPVAAQVQFAPVNEAGNVSVTAALVAVDGPEFVTVTV